MPIKLDSMLCLAYLLLAKLNVTELRLRFEILRQFNACLKTVLPLLNLDSSLHLVWFILTCRGLIFHSTKMEFFYDVLDKIAIAVGSVWQTQDRYLNY